MVNNKRKLSFMGVNLTQLPTVFLPFLTKNSKFKQPIVLLGSLEEGGYGYVTIEAFLRSRTGYSKIKTDNIL